MRSAAILIVGDEILSGEIRDENGPYAMRILSKAGVQVTRTVTVPDDEAAIVGEIGRLRALADAVIVSGGVGPTHDDVTRPAVAQALGVSLEINTEAEERVRVIYERDVTESELSMAVLPVGSRVITGRRTPTFGIVVGRVFVLPGVPLLFRDIACKLADEFDADPLHRAEIITERREAAIASILAAVQARFEDVAIGSYPVIENGQWLVRVVIRARDPDQLRQVDEELRAELF